MLYKYTLVFSFSCLLIFSTLWAAERKGSIVEFNTKNEPGAPTLVKAYKDGEKVLKLEVYPDISSHSLKLTGVFDSAGTLLIATIEMWDVLDGQAERLNEPEFHSIQVYGFRDGKIVYRSSKKDNDYLASSKIHSYLMELKGK